MGIRRTELAFERDFTRIPNAWLRDKRLSRRARGLLAEIMTHSVGWHVSISSLQKAGTEGRDAIGSALKELKALGYVRLVQSHGEGGRWNEVEYELADPATGDGFSVSGGFTGSGSTANGSAASGESATKKTRVLEDHLEEDDQVLNPTDLVVAAAAEAGGVPALGFEDFYQAYPRRMDRRAAEKAFEKAVKTTSVQVIVAGAIRLAQDPNLPEKKYIKYPASWLNAGSWDDEPMPPRGGRGQERQQEAVSLVQRYRDKEQSDVEVRSGVAVGMVPDDGRPSGQRAIG